MDQNELKNELLSLSIDSLARVSDLRQSCRMIPDAPGVYFVLRDFENKMPEFLETGTGGAHKGIDLNYPIDELKDKWVDDTMIMYIGKSDSSLRSRIRTYIRHGMGHDAPHRGGRAIWQLPDSANLAIGWRAIKEGESATEIEHRLLNEFRKRHFMMLPFANWRE